MKILTIALIIILFTLVVGHAQKVTDGFKGYQWGTPRTKIDSVFVLALPVEKYGMTFYSTTLDSLGGAKLLKCEFIFYNDEFAGVYVETNGWDDSDQLKRTLIAAYGEPEQPDSNSEENFWNSKLTTRIFKYNKSNLLGKLVMLSTSHVSQLEEEKKQKAEKEKDDF